MSEIDNLLSEEEGKGIKRVLAGKVIGDLYACIEGYEEGWRQRGYDVTGYEVAREGIYLFVKENNGDSNE